MCKRCGKHAHAPGETVCPFCLGYRTLSNDMRARKNSKESQGIMKEMQAKRDALTEMGHDAYNNNFWASGTQGSSTERAGRKSKGKPPQHSAEQTDEPTPQSRQPRRAVQKRQHEVVDNGPKVTQWQDKRGKTTHSADRKLNPKSSAEGGDEMDDATVYAQEMQLERRTTGFMEDFGVFMNGPQQNRNQPNQKARWLRHGMTYVSRMAHADQNGEMVVAIRTLQLQQNQMDYLTNMSASMRGEATGVFTKLMEFAETFRVVSSQQTLANMRKSADFERRQVTKNNQAGNDVATLTAQKKWTDSSTLRAGVLTGSMRGVAKLKEQLKSHNNGGMRYKTFGQEELRLLAAFPVGVIDLASKPTRDVVLSAITTEEAQAWLDSGGTHVRKQGKTSVKNRYCVLPTNEVVKSGLTMYVDTIRPVLAMQGKSKAHMDVQLAAAISDQDIKRAHELMIMPPDKWQLLLLKKGVTIEVGGKRAPPQWKYVHDNFGPWRWDERKIKTKKKFNYRDNKPTLVQLRIAVNSTLNDTLLLTPMGDPMTKCGDHLGYLTMRFAGVKVQINTLRAILTTEMKQQGSAQLKIADEALEHTQSTSEKHYQKREMEVLGREWAQLYDAGVDMEKIKDCFSVNTKA